MGEEGMALRDALAIETGGNPFFVGALLQHLRETGGIYQVTEWRTSPDIQERGMPVSVREVVERRVAHLGDTVGQVLVTAAVVGQEFDLPVVARASELSEDAVLIALDTACEATLVSNVSPDRYSFVHAIIQHSLYNSVSATRTARLHRKVGEAIEALPSAPGRISELAYHFGRLGSDAGKGMTYARLAGDQAMAQFAAPEAMEWFEQALDLAEQAGADDDSRARILAGLGNARRYAGDPLYRQTLLDAGSLARRAGNTELLAEAVLSNTRGIFSASGATDTERIDLLQSACEVVTDDAPLTRARVLALLASETMFSEDLDCRKAWADEAIDLARSSGSGLTVAAAINSVLLTIATPANLTERLRLCDEAVAAAQDCGDPWVVFWANNLLGFTRAQTGDLAWANDAYDHSRAIAEKLDQPILVWLTTYIDAGLVLHSGIRPRPRNCPRTRSSWVAPSASPMLSASSLPNSRQSASCRDGATRSLTFWLKRPRAMAFPPSVGFWLRCIATLTGPRRLGRHWSHWWKSALPRCPRISFGFRPFAWPRTRLASWNGRNLQAGWRIGCCRMPIRSPIPVPCYRGRSPTTRATCC